MLDRLLEDERLVIDGISGTSAGAMNGTMLVYGMVIGGREGAREILRTFWRRIAECESYGIFQPTPLDRLLGHHNLDHSPLYWAFDAVTRVLSPYQLNPTGMNPLGNILSELVDFDRVRAAADMKLFVCATNVRTGPWRSRANVIGMGVSWATRPCFRCSMPAKRATSY
ncbi:MAG: patatin-like phospholipase family protein [Chromatiales bacterium]